MKMNRAMEKLLEEYRILNQIEEITLQPKLASILSQGIVELGDCYFLRALLPDSFDIDAAVRDSVDRTELESEANHLHIGDYIDQSEMNIQLLIEQAVCYALSLQAIFPKTEDFDVILGCSFEPFVDCNIRFHNKRFEEDWLSENLDGYDDAVLLLD